MIVNFGMIAADVMSYQTCERSDMNVGSCQMFCHVFWHAGNTINVSEPGFKARHMQTHAVTMKFWQDISVYCPFAWNSHRHQSFISPGLSGYPDRSPASPRIPGQSLQPLAGHGIFRGALSALCTGWRPKARRWKDGWLWRMNSWTLLGIEHE